MFKKSCVVFCILIITLVTPAAACELSNITTQPIKKYSIEKNDLSKELINQNTEHKIVKDSATKKETFKQVKTHTKNAYKESKVNHVVNSKSANSTTPSIDKPISTPKAVNTTNNTLKPVNKTANDNSVDQASNVISTPDINNDTKVNDTKNSTNTNATVFDDTKMKDIQLAGGALVVEGAVVVVATGAVIATTSATSAAAAASVAASAAIFVTALAFQVILLVTIVVVVVLVLAVLDYFDVIDIW